MKYYKLKDNSFAAVNDFFDINDDANHTILHLTNDKVEELDLLRDEEKYCVGRVDNVEIRLEDKFGISHRYRNLECNHQYHFTRDEMTKVFEEVFPLNSKEWNWDNVWYCDFKDTDSFHSFRDEDEFYILHKPSGTMINWYKHMGRSNTCNKDLSLDELKLFLLLLRTELVEENINKAIEQIEKTKGLMV
jgi:hypothetical protein